MACRIVSWQPLLWLGPPDPCCLAVAIARSVGPRPRNAVASGQLHSRRVQGLIAVRVRASWQEYECGPRQSDHGAAAAQQVVPRSTRHRERHGAVVAVVHRPCVVRAASRPRSTRCRECVRQTGRLRGQKNPWLRNHQVDAILVFARACDQPQVTIIASRRDHTCSSHNIVAVDAALGEAIGRSARPGHRIPSLSALAAFRRAARRRQLLPGPLAVDRRARLQ